MLQQLRSFLVGDGMFLYGSDCTGDSNNCLCCLFSGRTVLIWRMTSVTGLGGSVIFPDSNSAVIFSSAAVISGSAIHLSMEPSSIRFYRFTVVGLFSVNRMLTGNFFLIGHPSKQTELEYTKLDASFVLDLFLEGGSKLGKALVGHDVKDIDILVLDAFTVLVHAQAQATAHLLAAGKGGLLLDQGADLKHVGVVPAFRSAEWEKINRSGHSKLRSHSLSA